MRRRGWRSRLIAVTAVTVLGFAFAPARGTASTASADWSMFGHDQTHSGVSPETTPNQTDASALTLKWRVSSGTSHPMVASPTVVFNATLNKELVYIATEGFPARVVALDAATGAIVWSHGVPASVRDTPAVSNGVVYFGTHDHSLYALNATTGAQICSYQTTGMIESSPVVGNVDGTGDVVYFGDIGLGESRNAGHEWAVNGVGNTNGNCTLKWSFNGFGVTVGGTRTGSWSSPALAQGSDGKWVVVFGSTNPDESVYSLDAVTGAENWRFSTVTGSPGDKDVGAGPDISPPGVNGIADGAVYLPGKNQIFYALDLKTGAQLWSFNLKQNAGSGAKSICTPALLGSDLICSYNTFVYDFNAVTGALNWRTAAITAGTFIASPAISGPSGGHVIVVGDTAGVEHAYSLAGGTSLFSYATTTSIVSSTALADGMAFFSGVDGYAYALG